MFDWAVFNPEDYWPPPAEWGYKESNIFVALNVIKALYIFEQVKIFSMNLNRISVILLQQIPYKLNKKKG